MKSPAREEGGHDQVVYFLDIVSRDVGRINDLVQGEQRPVVIIGEMGADLRSQNVILVVQHGKVFHGAHVDLEDDGTIRAWPRGLPS